jgi:c-di-GMP-related signal transduction protein
LTGLFSQIEPIIGVPFAQIAPHLSLSPEIEQAIVGDGHKSLLGNVLTVTRAYEAGEWTESEESAANLGVSLSALSSIYLRVLTWSRLQPPDE